MLRRGAHSSVVYAAIIALYSASVFQTGVGGAVQLETATEQQCAPIPSHLIASANLTDSEMKALADICWNESVNELIDNLKTRNTIPPGVQCEPYTWCDGDNMCSVVCKRGSVEVNRWLTHALQTQLLATHNSAITLADGYGNLDLYFEQYLKWIKWAGSTHIQTNNQWLSLTDQLNLGVRVVELDTHWVQGYLRIAHCGGAHISLFNRFIDAVNVVAKLLGKSIKWDTETFGCMPSLSSIPAGDQRRFLDALQEIKAWMDRPEHKDEFLVLFLDDQLDLLSWGLVPLLLQEIQQVLPLEEILTPPEFASQYSGNWPSIDSMVAAGKRYMFVSVADYGEAMASMVFARGMPVCRWLEPELVDLRLTPDCSVFRPKTGAIEPMLQGRLFRTMTCELMYGPMNCEFVYHGVNAPLLDEYTLPSVVSCGLNMPSPDLLTPERAATTVWSWAPGYPFAEGAGAPPQLPQVGAWTVLDAAKQSLWKWVGQTLQALLRKLLPGWMDVQQHVDDPSEVGCAAMRVEDGRWITAACGAGLPTACRVASASNGTAATWVLGQGAYGQCPEGYKHHVPMSAPDNAALHSLLQQQTQSAAYLPVTGPAWSV